MFSLFKKEKGPAFISRRIATRKDIKFGFFSMVNDSGDEISVPYKIAIPQPIVHINKENNERTDATLLQAELVTKTEMKGKVICTIMFKNGQRMQCLLEELELSKNKF